MKIKTKLHLFFSLMCLVLFSQAHANEREKLSLDKGWLFHLGDIPFPEIKGHSESYNSAKAGNAGGAAALEYDDSSWRKLDLPHDWAIEGPIDENANISEGYRHRGFGWYRRYLQLNEEDRGKHIELQFDGIATHSTIWVNGNLISRNWSGYNSIYVDITPYLRYGDALNTIAIRVDANAMEGWWYEGAGIYRHTWLVKRNPVHIQTDGLYAMPRETEHDHWEIPIAVTLENSGKADAEVAVSVDLFDPAGKKVASNNVKTHVAVFAQQTAQLPIHINNPELWSLEKTNLYRVEARIESVGKIIDSTSLNTGFRRIRFDAQQGFFLNDKHTKIKGVSIHQDHAGVGVAVPDAIWEYRLRRLKELGVNAIRFAHNAQTNEVLDMVDRMGFVVMDENRNFNPSPDYIKQLEWMVRRDRHHPAIILWSVFNEEPTQGSEVGYEMVRRMTAAVKALDNTRPVTAAMNGGFFNDINVAQAVDVVGFNYQLNDFDRYHQLNPTVPITSSEDTSGFMTRGEFTTDADKHVVASYDDEAAPWGNTHRDAWEGIDRRDFVAGGFVWSGFDYHGEPTPYEWPTVSSSFGIMDINGFAKTAFYIHQVQWIKDRPLIFIAPHWNWNEGKTIRVMVMANTERVKLMLNGRDLGEQKTDPYRMNFFEVPYQSGKLEALGLNDNKVATTAVIETTGEAVALKLIPDRKALMADSRDAMPITVQAVDSKGRVVPDAAHTITFDIAGSGKSIGHGNGNPNSHEDEKGKTRQLFHGLAQLLVQSKDSAGVLQVTATAVGLKSAYLSIPVQKVALVPSVASTEYYANLSEWRISPATAQPLNQNQKISDNDMNSWHWGSVPVRESSSAVGNFRLFRTSFTLRGDLAKGNAKIVFARIVGKAEVWLDGKLLGKTSQYKTENFSVALPSGAEPKTLTMLIEAESGQASGIDGVVKIQ